MTRQAPAHDMRVVDFAEMLAGPFPPLQAAARRGRALTLAGDADVVIEGLRPGAIRRPGLEHVRARNPWPIHVSPTGSGLHDGRRA